MALTSILTPSSRKYRTSLIRVGMIIWLLVAWYWIQTRYLSTRTNTQLNDLYNMSTYAPTIDSDSFKTFINSKYPKFFNVTPTESIYQFDEDTSLYYDPDVYSNVYDQILKINDTGSLFNEKLYHILLNLDYEDRCNLYFNSLYGNHKSGDPIVAPHKSFDFNRGHYRTWDEFKQDMIEELQKDNPDIKTLTVEQEKKLSEDYTSIQNNINQDNQGLHDFITHLKVFNKCYLSDNDIVKDAFIYQQQNTIKSFKVPERLFNSLTIEPNYHNEHYLETLIYPWLSQKSPLFETSDGKTYEILPNTQFHSTQSFLSLFKAKLRGKGIVLTIADSHVDNTIRLMHLLRQLDNDLPIQIIYDSTTLSEESKYQIFQSTTSKFHSLRKQDLTFVQVNRAIAHDFIGKFGGFGNKILAVLFNTFEDMIFLDADVVITQPPAQFFELKKYQEHGTLFYKDRSAVEYRPDSDIQFFKKLMNNQLDEIMFNLPQITESTLKLPFFSKRVNHLMESGLVLINRRKHFDQALIMAHMNFYMPIQARLYGDKELFWLSMAMMGDESFQFNNHFAAAIGIVTPDSERILDIGKAHKFKGKEICSNHPAHINDEDNHSLLWFNSGFVFCNQLPKVNFEGEFDVKKRYTHIKTLNEFKAFFTSKLIIKSAIVPPHLKINDDNNDGEPNLAWLNMGEYCGGYTWCGYSSVGTGDSPDAKGFLIRYSEEEQLYFGSLGDIWMEEVDYRSYAQIEKDEKEGKKKYTLSFVEEEPQVDEEVQEKLAANKRKESLLKKQQKLNEKLDDEYNPKVKDSTNWW
ncbi:putative alpha-1,3-mannosyltransferase [Scheffersomyces coipomensis]|uniref:putative alpha-1,3-mannosyltransferase n=1 Tax=Scheffersomyces coipomensis TaxID=1788519 RepID=UPI00315CB87F